MKLRTWLRSWYEVGAKLGDVFLLNQLTYVSVNREHVIFLSENIFSTAQHWVLVSEPGFFKVLAHFP